MLALLLALPFLAVVWLMLRPRAGGNEAAAVVGMAAVAGLGILFATASQVFGGEVLRWRLDWLPEAGLSLGVRLDGYAWTFALMVLGIGSLIVLYARWYLHHDDPPRRFFACLALFMGAMLGVVISGNLLAMLLFWELTSIASFLLIGFWQHKADARRGARMALAVTGAGGLALFAGVLLIGRMVGSFELDVVLASGGVITAHPLYLPALGLVLLGAFTKSAQFPFHFWLPQAMAAPTPVSAYLHSATMVKCGVFLLARLHPALAGTEEWFLVVGGIGLCTLVLGSFFALFQQDLKGLLAYSTISHLGLITLLLGMGSAIALVAAVFHVLNHATFKASLFMAAGIIDHQTGTRDFRRLNGLAKHMPITAALAIVASLAMAGVPLFNGFLSKEMFLTETLNLSKAGGLHLLIPGFALLAAAFSVAYSLRFIVEVFFGGEPKCPNGTPREPPRFMRVPVEVLALWCLAVGLLPALTMGGLLGVAASGALNGPLPVYTLAVWHGINTPLLMSLAGLIMGVAIFLFLQRIGALRHDPGRPLGKVLHDALMAALLSLGRASVRLLESGRLQAYLGLVVLLLLVAMLAALGARLPLGGEAQHTAGWLALLLFLGGLAPLLLALRQYRQRLTAVLLVSAVGLAVILAFVGLSAPDLALTQLLVEVVSLLLILLALRYLPQQSPPERAPGRRAWHALLALAGGGSLGALAYAVMTQPNQSIAEYFLRTSLSEGGGRNVVNVIIVDYRGLDTLGEITVVGIAALIIAALLQRVRLPVFAMPPDREHGGDSLMLRIVADLLLPLAVAVSLYLFLRGHNAPGGGFIAALVLVAAMFLQVLARGIAGAAAVLTLDWTRWIGIGLLLALATGIGAFAFGHPFLTSSTPYVVLPGLGWLGSVPLASASAFDTGVYLVVTASLVLILMLLAQLRLRDEDAAGGRP